MKRASKATITEVRDWVIFTVAWSSFGLLVWSVSESVMP